MKSSGYHTSESVVLRLQKMQSLDCRYLSHRPQREQESNFENYKHEIAENASFTDSPTQVQ